MPLGRADPILRLADVCQNTGWAVSSACMSRFMTTARLAFPQTLLARPVLRVLHLEDSDADSVIVRRYLERQGFGGHVVRVHTRADFLEQLAHKFDVVLADHSMPGFDSGEALQLVRAHCPDVPFIIVSGTITEEAAVESVKGGAADYVWKDRLQRLGPAIEAALRERQHRTEKEAALRARRESEALSHAVLASLSQLIVVVDAKGVIVKTNAAWQNAGAARGRGGLTGHDVGTDYLDVCRHAAAAGDDDAQAALAGISAVLAGDLDEFTMEYACHAPTGPAWYTLSVTPLGGGLGTVLSHQSITALRGSQERLAQNETRLKAIFEGSLDAILLAGDDARYVDANPAATALLGYSREEMLGLSVRDVLLVPAGQDFDAYWSAIRARGTHSGEFVLYRKDGTTVEVEGRATFDILPGLHLRTLRDITARKQAEATLRESEEQYRLLADTATDVILTIDASSTIRYANRAVEAVFGYTPAEIVGTSLSALMPAGLRPRHDAGMDRYFRTGEQTMPWGQVETRGLRKDGAEIQIAVSFGEYRIGEERFFTGIIRDTTVQKATQEALRESEERLRLVSQATHDTVWDLDVRSETVVMNAAFTDVFGWAAPAGGRFAIDWMLERVHPDDQRRIAESLHGIAWGDEQSWMAEYRFERADGTWADVLNRSHIVRSADGMATRIVGAVVDRSAQKAVERALVEAKEAAEAIARAKSSLMMNMSHEIRTPLTAVIGYAELLGDECGPEQTEQREYAAVIEQGGRRLLETLNSVLDLAQIEAGSLPLATVAVDLRAEAEAAITAIQPLARVNGLALVLTGPPTIARADRPALARVLTNLLGNAVKFTKRGTVDVSVWTEGGSAWLRVADTGVGIDAAFLPRVFDDFEQESTGAARQFEGSGLGLTITRGLVELMGGEIAVESEKGVGSVFTVRLPTP